ncbi:MAG: chorismate synthase [Nitrospirae bacterium]|nr:chorismate synthase [Nitrospirota bacterium]
MPHLRTLSGGESHGKAIIGIVDGLPSNLPIEAEDINVDLKRRQMGYGRGGRMKIESDRVEFLSGVRWGKTLGSPITLKIDNRDWKNWESGMSDDAAKSGSIAAVTKPRPGHADLPGVIKYGFKDVRNVLERSSARETAGRVAVGALCKKFIGEFGIKIGSYVINIGGVGRRYSGVDTADSAALKLLYESAEKSDVRCPYPEDSKRMVCAIDEAKEQGDTLGGIFEVFALNVPTGLGSHTQWDKRLDGLLAQSLMAIQAVKGVETGLGFDMAVRPGSQVMDEIFYEKGSGFLRKTNNCGGVEGGISNGMPIVIRGAMKPIPTQRKPLRSVDIETKSPVEAAYERSDVCAVPACAVIAEAVTAITIADLMLTKFGGDTMDETISNFNKYMEYISEF